VELDRNLAAPRPGPRMEFLTVKHTQVERYLCVSSRIWAHFVHWTGQHTLPCTLKVGVEGQVLTRCVHCDAQRPKRWKGYLHVVPLRTGEHCFLCLSENAGFFLQKAAADNYDLRGLQLDVRRKGKRAQSELIVEINTNMGRKKIDYEEIDPMPYLATVFRQRKPLTDCV
jgi:hypothetical protein